MSERPAAHHPRVSVIMPAYNAERYLAAAVESILTQDFQDLELLVLDDGSSDGTLAILQELAAQDDRLRVERNPHNLGIVATRNRGFSLCSPHSTYLAIMDSDDVSLPHRISSQVSYLDGHPECALVGSHNLVIDAGGTVVGERRYPCSYEEICRVITRYNPISQPVAMIRRSALDEVGHYDARYPRCQDYDLWCRLASRHPVANIDDFLLQYRLSPTQGKATHLKLSLRRTLDIQRRFMFHPRFRNPLNLAAWLAQASLLAVPESVIMQAFKRLRYRSAD